MNIFGNAPIWQIIPFYLFLVWSLIWKGISLWKAAKYGQRNWFIVLLIVDIFGVLNIVYLFGFAKKRMTIQEIVLWFKKIFFTKEKNVKSSK